MDFVKLRRSILKDFIQKIKKIIPLKIASPSKTKKSTKDLKDLQGKNCKIFINAPEQHKDISQANG